MANSGQLQKQAKQKKVIIRQLKIEVQRIAERVIRPIVALFVGNV